MAGQIQKIQPPALPWARDKYERSAEDQYSNVLRLFFNRLVNIVNSLLGTQGAQYIDSPNGLFYCTSNQPIAVVDTAQHICFENTYLSNGVRNPDGDTIIIDIDGVYNFQFSGQVESTNSSAKLVRAWIRKNDVDIGYSSHAYTISGVNNKLAITWNFIIDMQAGDTLQMMWASNDINITLTAITPVAPYPGTSSAVMAITYVSALPDVLPTPP
jgi:hypothetical protein